MTPGSKSITVWIARLKAGDAMAAKRRWEGYDRRLATTEPSDCSLPIKLKRKGAGSRVCKNWPKTVTISRA